VIQFLDRAFRRLRAPLSSQRRNGLKRALGPARLMCETLEDRRLLSMTAPALADGVNDSGMSIQSMSCELPAEAASLLQSSPPVGATVRGASTTKTLMTEKFEGTFPGSGWTLFGDPTWGTSTYKKHAGKQSAYCVGSDYSPSTGYPDNVTTWMVYGPFDLSDADKASLAFYTFVDTELNYDWLCWGASLDGNQFYGSGISGNTKGWLKRSLDLTAVNTLGNLCGQSEVWIGFWFYSDSYVTDVGGFIDDVTLTKNVPAVDLKTIDVYAADPTDLTKPLASIGPDQSVALVCKYQYTGSSKAVEQTVRLQVDDGEYVDIDVSLNGTGTYYAATPWTAALGTHTLSATLDVHSQITETNEKNNARTEKSGMKVTSTGGGRISGTVWDDLDGDGIRDKGEPGLSGFTLFLDQDADGEYDDGERTTTSDASGNYTFYGLAAGTYFVGQMASEGWEQTSPAKSSSAASARATDGLTVAAVAAPTETAGSERVPSRISTVAKYHGALVQQSTSLPAVMAAGAAATSLPSSYDLRDYGYVTSVKNQGSCGSCWTFAAMASLESSILVDGGPGTNLSENNLKNYHGFDWGPCDGGNSSISEAYFSRGSGPVSESDDPYHDWDDAKTPAPSYESQYYVKSMLRFDSPGEIKNALMSEGALDTYFYWNSSYYNSSAHTYYYGGSASANHEVTIVGWDDTKVVSGTSTVGAWLIKNSWGTGWGDGGYFWLSYADTYGKNAEAFCDAVSADTYNKIYSYDTFGDVWEYDFSYAFNAFTPTENSELAAVGFFTEADGAGYTISVYDTYSGGTLSGLLATQSGTAEYAGYHAIDLASDVSLISGDAVYVALHITGGGAYPMAVDARYSGYNSDSTASPGQSYYSYDGVTWTDLTRVDATANVCIKMLTRGASTPSGELKATLKAGGKATGFDFGNQSLYLGLFDFGTTSSKVEGGYSRVSQKTTFTGSNAFGWSSGTIKTADRTTGSYLNRDVNYTTDGTFTVAAPDGTYTVSLLLGDQKAARDSVCVAIEGVTLDTGINTLKGELVWKTYTVDVSDHELTIRLWDAGGSDAYASIAAVKILAVGASQSARSVRAVDASLQTATVGSLVAATSLPARTTAVSAMASTAPAASVATPAEPSPAVRLELASVAFPVDAVFPRGTEQKTVRGPTLPTASEPEPDSALESETLAWKDLADLAFASF